MAGPLLAWFRSHHGPPVLQRDAYSAIGVFTIARRELVVGTDQWRLARFLGTSHALSPYPHSCYGRKRREARRIGERSAVGETFGDTGSTPASVAQTCGWRAVAEASLSVRIADTIVVNVEHLLSPRSDVASHLCS